MRWDSPGLLGGLLSRRFARGEEVQHSHSRESPIWKEGPAISAHTASNEKRDDADEKIVNSDYFKLCRTPHAATKWSRIVGDVVFLAYYQYDHPKNCDNGRTRPKKKKNKRTRWYWTRESVSVFSRIVTEWSRVRTVRSDWMFLRLKLFPRNDVHFCGYKIL